MSYLNPNWQLPDADKWKKEFDIINRNGLEPEFPISKGNGFELIADGSLEGVARYANLLPAECVSMDWDGFDVWENLFCKK